MKFAVASILLLPIAARAAYPPKLGWDSHNHATLEFCQDGSNYGYRAVGDTTACGSRPGPLIVMEPSKTYTLTLYNSAPPDVVTNIHTHGLHIMGDGNADNVFREVAGGQCLQYTYEIPADHSGGTYWYHPHKHGLVNEQTSGGAFGAIVIPEPSPQSLTSWATDPDNEQLLLISAAGSLLGNGNANEVLVFRADRWYRLRILIVEPAARPGDLTFSNSCFVYKVASDGVWMEGPFGINSGHSFELTGASRADFAINCPTGIHPVEWDRKVAATIQSNLFAPPDTGMTGDVSDLGSPPGYPESLNKALITADTLDTPATSTSISLSGGKINGENALSGLGDLEYGQVHEFVISGSGAHPFHLHLYHMLIVEAGGCGAHKENEFYDTVSGDGESGSCKVRFYAWDFGERMILHCHVLQHEDNGAINFFNVVHPPENAPLAPDPYSCSPGSTPPCVPDGSLCEEGTCCGVCKGKTCRGGRRFLRKSSVE